MARQEQDREDLIREATRLVPRAEWEVSHEDAPVVLGVRLPGALSVFFGADPVLHFNSRGELRRAYADGALWKAEEGRLVRMERRRGDREVVLASLALDFEETATRLDQWLDRIAALRRALRRETARYRRGVGPGASDAAFWTSRLDALAERARVADRPHVV